MLEGLVVVVVVALGLPLLQQPFGEVVPARRVVKTPPAGGALPGRHHGSQLGLVTPLAEGVPGQALEDLLGGHVLHAHGTLPEQFFVAVLHGHGDEREEDV
jgi:hypothetical protein